MRSLLVPLDGSDLGLAILDDAVRLAGPGGTLILTQEVPRPRGWAGSGYDLRPESRGAREYLDAVAEGLPSRGVFVRTVTRSTISVSTAIEELARAHEVDMIACATHGRGTMGMLLWGSVAWKVLSQSSVPVLLRHPSSPGELQVVRTRKRRILVPLDGSTLAEKALPLAQELAAEWQAPMDIVRVIPEALNRASTFPARDYLAATRSAMSGEVRQHVLVGSIVEALTAFVQGAGVTDIVITSHGRTGLARVFLGSVAHDLIHRLSLPVIVVPAMATAAAELGNGPIQREVGAPVSAGSSSQC